MFIFGIAGLLLNLTQRVGERPNEGMPTSLTFSKKRAIEVIDTRR